VKRAPELDGYILGIVLLRLRTGFGTYVKTQLPRRRYHLAWSRSGNCPWPNDCVWTFSLRMDAIEGIKAGGQLLFLLISSFIDSFKSHTRSSLSFNRYRISNIPALST
jgi:hypothetical protein